MDKDDIKLCKMLMADCRTPFHALASSLDMSIPAVHKRTRSLMEQGIIRGFFAEIDIRTLKGASAMVYGISRSDRPDEAAEEVAKDDRVWLILHSGGGMVHVFGFLRTPSEKEEFGRLVADALKMDNHIAVLHGIRPGDKGIIKTEVEPLTPMEGRILASLQKDARKRPNEVAAETGLSVKTVSSRLGSMRNDGKAVFTIWWSPDYSSDAISLMHIKVPPERKGEAIMSIQNEFQDNLAILSAFRDDPSLIMCTFWTPAMREMPSLAAKVSSAVGAVECVPYMVYKGQRYECWKDRLLSSMAAPSR